MERDRLIKEAKEFWDNHNLNTYEAMADFALKVTNEINNELVHVNSELNKTKQALNSIIKERYL